MHDHLETAAIALFGFGVTLTVILFTSIMVGLAT